ncbi:hypothetical protein DPEC_G00291940 [Dallia pectoralis]|uniref:Uncharacterized protein n=1 Tax=Dallia pectoralis TaxID=75939 RepID=A0ACC2FHT2_DALPE|nr:hypothetical protein DPEC_G00291940 [Dallia pectoralis]
MPAFIEKCSNMAPSWSPFSLSPPHQLNCLRPVCQSASDGGLEIAPQRCCQQKEKEMDALWCFLHISRPRSHSEREGRPRASSIFLSARKEQIDSPYPPRE